MSVVIDSIVFKNYRQFRDVKINLECDFSKLNAIVAVNGTGKTTLLNGINWCLYASEPDLTETEKALPIINEQVLDECADNESVTMSIELNLIEDDNYIKLERSETFFVMDLVSGIKNIAPVGRDNSKLVVTVNYKESIKNAEIIEEEDANIFVKQYFDQTIKEYYFFDGEKLEEYFTNNRSKMIKDSIYNISQVTLLQNTINHLTTTANEKTRIYSKGDPELEQLNNEYTDLIHKNSDKKRLIEENYNDIKSKKEELDKIDRSLRDYGPVSKQQFERDRLTKDLKDVSNAQKNKKDEKMTLIRNNIYNLMMYPKIKKIYDYILSKENEGKFPPDVDKARLQKTLDHHVCDFCHSHLTAEGEEYLINLLDKFAVSNKTSTYLVSLKSTYEKIMNEAKQYKKKIAALNIEEKELMSKYVAIDTEIKKISAFLANYDSDNKSINVPKLEEDRQKIQANIDSSKNIVAGLEAKLHNDEEYLEQLLQKIETANAEKNQNDKLKNECRILRNAIKQLEEIRDKIMISIKDEIKVKTWKLFNDVIWKDNSFQSIDIDDNYSLSVIGSSGREAAGSLSATEKMALAYAFTFAIHEASGKNCPVVIDSPLGRTSDVNKINLVNKFIEISKHKQIVLLLTKDECSPEVTRLILDSGANIKYLELSKNEKEIGNGGLI